jgi:hypothetical protein
MEAMATDLLVDKVKGQLPKVYKLNKLEAKEQEGKDTVARPQAVCGKLQALCLTFPEDYC